MSDAQFITAENSYRSRFSVDFHRHLNRARRRPSPGPVSTAPIGQIYDSSAPAALLRGVAASVVTTVLFIGGILVLTAPQVDPVSLVPAVIVDGTLPAAGVELA